MDLYINNKFASFSQLESKCIGLPYSNFFSYLPARNVVEQSLFFDTLPLQHTFYDHYSQVLTSKYLISQFVDTFTQPASSSHLREAWSRETGSDELWDEGLESIKDSFINASLQLAQFKVMHHIHSSKTRLGLP